MRAATEQPGDEIDLLQEKVRTAHVKVATEVRDQPIQTFSCRELPLGRLQLFDIVIDPIVIRRRFVDIEADSNDDYLLATQLEGTVLIQQGDAEFTQVPGTLALMSAGRPYSVIHAQPQSHRLVLHIPSAVYRERIQDNKPGGAFKARLFPAGGLVNVVHGMLRSLAFDGDALDRREQYTLAESLLELTAAIIRSDANREFDQQHARQSALFRRVLEYLEANFDNFELSPEKIARANGISMRYLHSLFHQSGMSVSRWLWERRLKAAREDLLDPALSNLRVSEIALRRGFNDPAHFSRTFRKRFDISPTGLRQYAARAREADKHAT